MWKSLITAALIAAPITASANDIVSRVNAEVNQEIFYRPDYGGDKWSLTGRYGDCEDYALRKVARLASESGRNSASTTCRVVSATPLQSSMEWRLIIGQTGSILPLPSLGAGY